MLSEKTYWIILIAGLCFFVTVDLIWIMPRAPDLGTNLISEAIFTIFAIVFLSWLFKLRETLQYEPQKKAMLEELKREIYFISTEIYMVSGEDRNLLEKSGSAFSPEFLSAQMKKWSKEVKLSRLGKRQLAS